MFIFSEGHVVRCGFFVFFFQHNNRSFELSRNTAEIILPF